MAKKRGKKLGEQAFGCDGESAGIAGLVAAQVDDIWRRLSTGEIDLSYACTHVTYDGYKPVYDEDVLTTLLLGCGYRIDSVLAFLDQFAKTDGAPIVIMNEKKMSVYEEVKPLKGVPGK